MKQLNKVEDFELVGEDDVLRVNYTKTLGAAKPTRVGFNLTVSSSVPEIRAVTGTRAYDSHNLWTVVLGSTNGCGVVLRAGTYMGGEATIGVPHSTQRKMWRRQREAYLAGFDANATGDEVAS